jgi:hypothetical protein
MVLSQVPWVTSQDESDRQVHRQVSGLLVYPFNRARRIETSVGLDAVAFDFRGGGVTPGGANSLVSSAAFVHDTAVKGQVSPLLGERYRVRLLSSAGDLNLVTAAAEYRRYITPVRGVTVATQAQQVARFGQHGSDPRLLPIVASVREVARGFYHNAVTERAPMMSALSVELRTPISRLLGRRLRSSAVPVEFFAFTDLARFGASRSLAPLEARTLWSSGAGARVNAAGFVLEANLVRPQTELNRDWRMVVNFRPAF